MKRRRLARVDRRNSVGWIEFNWRLEQIIKHKNRWKPCPECGGKGDTRQARCTTCRGWGLVART